MGKEESFISLNNKGEIVRPWMAKKDGRRRSPRTTVFCFSPALYSLWTIYWSVCELRDPYEWWAHAQTHGLIHKYGTLCMMVENVLLNLWKWMYVRKLRTTAQYFPPYGHCVYGHQTNAAANAFATQKPFEIQQLVPLPESMDSKQLVVHPVSCAV